MLEEMEQEARATVDVLSVVTLSEEERERFIINASSYWDKFYDKHEARFFKNRKWLPREFVELIDGSLCSGPFLSGPPAFPGKHSRFRVLEVGSGPGNSVVPILENRWRGEDETFVYACDFSERAVSLVKSSPSYNPQYCLAFQQDISKPDLTWPFPPEISSFPQTIRNLYACLRPGGVIFFRDYGLYDLSQIRVKQGRCIGRNFYTRGDGTCAYFFEQGLVEKQIRTDRRLIVNRRKRLKMYRVYIQGKYQKPLF
ncbi:tRNA N 3 methylcytidine methyltransferase METTL2 [Taenia crassiceps]|uniref:tRNA N(3)-methylcytidine methyltransferase n=1 Tax=Taenia crassiceps TaxID=6207 RepID=A0ABR4QCV7_9CEST